MPLPMATFSSSTSPHITIVKSLDNSLAKLITARSEPPNAFVSE